MSDPLAGMGFEDATSSEEEQANFGAEESSSEELDSDEEQVLKAKMKRNKHLKKAAKRSAHCQPSRAHARSH
jgi:hypothetical protein